MDAGAPPKSGLVPNQTVDLSAGISPVQLNLNPIAACPADVPISLSGQTVYFSYQPACKFVSGMKPFVLAVAWLTGGLIFFGAVRS